MAFSITYSGTEDGSMAQSMLSHLYLYNITLDVEWDTGRKDSSTAKGRMTGVSEGFLVLDETVHVPLGAILNIEIEDETTW
jgi:hypothetical protein